MREWSDITPAALIYTCLASGVLNLTILLLLYGQKSRVFFLLCRVFCCLSVPCTSLAFKDVEYLWLPCAAMMWLLSSFQLSGRNERLGSLRAVAKQASKPILSCSTEAHTALIGYWFQFHYGESTFLATNMGSHMLSCKYENYKALLQAALSQIIQKSWGPTFPTLANGTSLLRKVFLAPSSALSFGMNSVRSQLWLGSCRLSLDWQMKQSLGLFWTLERDCLFCRTLGLAQGMAEAAWITALPKRAETCEPLGRCYSPSVHGFGVKQRAWTCSVFWAVVGAPKWRKGSVYMCKHGQPCFPETHGEVMPYWSVWVSPGVPREQTSTCCLRVHGMKRCWGCFHPS